MTVGRATFPESAILETFSAKQLNGQSLTQQEFLSGKWLERLRSLPYSKQREAAPINGSDTVAEYLLSELLSDYT